MKKEVIEKLATFITAAFGLVAALAWNSAIQAVFKEFFPSPGNNISALLLYAVIVSIIAVILILWIGKLSSKVK